MKEEKQKFPRKVAIDVAKIIVEALKPACEKLIIAGSLRRGKQKVGDVEVLYIPKFETVADGFFDTKQINLVEMVLSRLLEDHVFKLRPNKLGRSTWGPENKLAIHTETGVPVDFFATREKCWFNYLVCRTGGQRNNVMIAEAAQKKNLEWNPYAEGFTNRATGEIIPVTSEQDVYRIAGLNYLDPFLRQ